LNATEITSLKGIGQARGLSHLNLQNNDFQGSTIPNELYNIFGLETLLLSGSKLSGSIARQVGYLTSLRSLQISHNQITGSIPREIGRLKNLKILDLSENDITGTLPSALNKLTNLVEFHMSCFTRSEGCISGTLLRFSELSSLKVINLGGNNIAGSIPYDFLQSSSKGQNEIQVTLTSNKLTGTIPSSLSTFVSDSKN
jgi:Leucine-rich repeat (LRR) protein